MRYYLLLFMAFTILSCNTEIPLQLSEIALNEKLVNLDDESVPLKTVLNAYQGQPIVIDFWATWCRDCIVDLPHIKDLQEQFPKAHFLSFSIDRNKKAWKNGIQKYNIQGHHYFMPDGWDGALADFIDLDWIPRYMILDADGKILFYEAVKANDENLINALKNEYF